jgi:hypothetical protein
MPITIPKSILTTPKVPSIAVIGLMVAQLIVFNVIKNLFTKCKFGEESSYRGSAEGYVRLKGGKEIRVEGNSGKYEVANCSIGAQ